MYTYHEKNAMPNCDPFPSLSNGMGSPTLFSAKNIELTSQLKGKKGLGSWLYSIHPAAGARLR